MNYEFSISSFFFGILILASGILLVRFHQLAADNFAGGVSSYERFKLVGALACALGLIVMINLHTLILEALVGAIFPGI